MYHTQIKKSADTENEKGGKMVNLSSLLMFFWIYLFLNNLAFSIKNYNLAKI